MVARFRSLSGRLLPNGVFDVLVQVALMQATYMAYRLVRGWIDDPQGAAVAFENGRDIIGIERSLGIFLEPSLQDTVGATSLVGDLGLLGLPERPGDGDARRARLPVPAPQRQLLLRAQHVHRLVGDRAGRLRAVPDGAAALLPRVGLRRQRRRLHRASQPDSATANALFNPYAAVPVDARRVRADDRHAARRAREAPRDALVLARLPAARHVRDRRDREPLRLRRGARRADRRPRLRRRRTWLARVRPVWAFEAARVRAA